MNNNAYLSITTQGDHVECRLGGWSQADQSYLEATRRRGDVTHFSNKSRKRLLDYMAKIDLPDNGAVFLTLTYPEEYPDCKEAKRHLNVFLQRIRRNFPTASGFWRMEFQKRGAPHFHLLMFNLPYWDKMAVASTWEQIIGARAFTRIEHMRSKRGCMSYMSKYLAKAENTVDLTTCHNSTQEWTGRHWGVHNRVELPMADAVTLRIKCDDFQRLIMYFKATVETCAITANHLIDWPWDTGFSCYVTNAKALVHNLLIMLPASIVRVAFRDHEEKHHTIRHYDALFAGSQPLR